MKIRNSVVHVFNDILKIQITDSRMYITNVETQEMFEPLTLKDLDYLLSETFKFDKQDRDMILKIIAKSSDLVSKLLKIYVKGEYK